MADPGQAAPTGREADPMHPAARATATKLRHQLTKRHLAAPGRAGWLLIHLFDVGREHSVIQNMEKKKKANENMNIEKGTCSCWKTIQNKGVSLRTNMMGKVNQQQLQTQRRGGLLPTCEEGCCHRPPIRLHGQHECPVLPTTAASSAQHSQKPTVSGR